MKALILHLLALVVLATPALAEWRKDERDTTPDYSYCADCIQNLDPSLLGKYLAKATLEYAKAKPVSFGEPNRYPEMLRYLAGSSRVQYRAGFELTLRKWVMEQPHDSIDPVMIYAKALELSNGDIHLALLGIHELLKNEARFFNDNFVYYSSTYDRRREFFERFIDLRGDLKERGGNYKGDHFGTWYRLFGMMLYTVHSAVEKGKLPRFKVYSVAVAAELGKILLLWPDRDKLKIFHNLRAVRTGISFFKAMSNPASVAGLGAPEEMPYLTSGRSGYGICTLAFVKLANLPKSIKAFLKKE